MDITSWLALFGQISLVAVLALALLNAVIGAALASWARMPIIVGVLLGVVLGWLGFVALGTVAIVRASRRPRSTPGIRARMLTPEDGRSGLVPLGLRSGGGIARIVCLIAILLASLTTLIVHWFVFDPVVLPIIRFWAWGSGLDTVVLVSAALLSVAGANSAFRGASRVSAILVAAIGAVWLVCGVAAVAVTVPVARLLLEIGAISFTVGDMLRGLGITEGPSVIAIPEWLDLSPWGIPAGTVDLSQLDLAAPLPAAELEAGPAFFIVIGVGVAGLVWAVFELIAAHRAALRRRPKAVITSTSAGVAGTTIPDETLLPRPEVPVYGVPGSAHDIQVGWNPVAPDAAGEPPRNPFGLG